MSERALPQVILVDDDPALLDALSLSLACEGFGVRAFASGEGLLAARLAPAYGCLILDYRLPGIDGLELLRRVRALGWTHPAILITTALPRIVAAAARAEIVLVDKPLDGRLIAKVRQLLGEWAAD